MGFKITLSTGTVIFLAILVLSLFLLLLVLLISGIKGKKKGKLGGGAKFFIVFFAVILMAASVTTPLVNYNIIDINLKYGWYSHKDEDGTKIKITRDSIEYHQPGHGDSDKKGTYVLESDTLIITWNNGTTDEYKIKHLGKGLYDHDGNKIYSYLKEQRGQE